MGYKVKYGREQTHKSASLLSKVMVTMIILALLQIGLLCVMLMLNGGFSYIKNYSYNMLSEKTGNRKNYIENMFNQKTSLVYEAANTVDDIVNRQLKENHVSAEAFMTDKELSKTVLSECAETLISLIRRDMVNDAFIILDSGRLYDEGGSSLRPGIYLRDTDTEENSISDNKDIFMEMGSSETARSYGLALDFEWSLYLDVTDNTDGNFDFYYEPLKNDQAVSDTPLYNLGYWSGLSNISATQQGSIKYTLPLITEDGKAYGVIGIGMLEKTIQTSMPANDFFSDSTCYILGLDSDADGQYQTQIHRGSAYARLVSPETVLSTRTVTDYNLYDFTAEDTPKVVGSIQRLNLYNSGSPYRHQNWALISVADKEELLSTYYTMLRSLLLSMLVSLGVSVVFAAIISRRISAPVAKMVKTLNNNRSENDLVNFNSSGITEIDALAASIVDLQIYAIEYASRVSRIITMSGNRLGVFMYDCRNESVFVGESLVKLLAFTSLPQRDVTMPAQEFKERLSAIDKGNVIVNLPIFRYEDGSDQPLNDIREIQYVDIGGASVWLKFSLTRDKTNVLGLVQDITLEKVRDYEYTAKLIEANNTLKAAYIAAEKANHTKTDFLSRMSHDIRTPMNAIIGMTTIAENHIDDREKLADCFHKISASSRYLLSLINEVLDMSKIEAGKFVLVQEKFNLIELLDNLLDMVKPGIKEKKHKLTVNIHKVEHENVISDSLRIQQVFMNIMSNAIKYTPESGQIEFAVTEKTSGQKNIGCYEFIFKDNGKGMRPEFLNKLFTAFEREEDERVSKEQGTGLGMAITYNIVRMMNGTIDVESEVDKGTTFTVTLYLPLNEAESVSLRKLHGRQALVVDSNKNACESAYVILQEIGMYGDGVLTEQDAIEKIQRAHRQEKDYDIIFLGLEEPSELSLDIIHEIAESCEEKIPIVLCSSYDWTKMEQKAKEAGIDVLISKPVVKSELITILKSLFGKEQKAVIETAKRKDFSGHRVLLVDDNELNREIALEILQMAKLEVDTVNNGKEAVEAFASSAAGTYDVIYMDIQMPVMNGYEASRTIRTLPNPDAQSIPIIAMTANAFAEDVRNAENAGMNEHIAKPLDIDRLFETLNRWIPPT